METGPVHNSKDNNLEKKNTFIKRKKWYNIFENFQIFHFTDKTRHTQQMCIYLLF